ncbi:unnamed protein product [Closterium sp. Naga37s-1]|nr:unnamed protein product [Closterium sp. Naga37s-1]
MLALVRTRRFHSYPPSLPLLSPSLPPSLPPPPFLAFLRFPIFSLLFLRPPSSPFLASSPPRTLPHFNLPLPPAPSFAVSVRLSLFSVREPVATTAGRLHPDENMMPLNPMSSIQLSPPLPLSKLALLSLSALLLSPFLVLSLCLPHFPYISLNPPSPNPFNTPAPPRTSHPPLPSPFSAFPSPLPRTLAGNLHHHSPPQLTTTNRGETLWGISQRYGVRVKDILRANGLTDVHHVELETTLFIPRSAASTAAAAAAAAAAPAAAPAASSDAAALSAGTPALHTSANTQRNFGSSSRSGNTAPVPATAAAAPTTTVAGSSSSSASLSSDSASATAAGRTGSSSRSDGRARAAASGKPRLFFQNTNLEQSEELALLQARARHQDTWSCIKGTVSSLYSSLHSSLPQQWHSSTAAAPIHPTTAPCSLSSSSSSSSSHPTLFKGPLLVSLVASLSLALLLSLLSFLRPVFLRFRALQAEREAATATANPLTPFGGLGMGVAQRGGGQGGGGVITDSTGVGAGIGGDENGRGGMGGGGDGGVGVSGGGVPLLGATAALMLNEDRRLRSADWIRSRGGASAAAAAGSVAAGMGRPDLMPEDVARDYEDIGRPDLTPEDVARDYEEIVRCYHEGMASSYESFLRDSGAMSAGRFRGGMPPKFRPKPKQR